MFENVEFVSLNRNYGQANDIRVGRINTKYCGFTRSVLNGAMYAVCCDADWFIYVEQDCLIRGFDFIKNAIGDSECDILVGQPAERAVGISGPAAPMLQQSLIIVRKSGFERFITGLLSAPWSDGEVSPEEIMRRRFSPLETLRIPYGRSRPIDFDRMCYYAQHFTDEELARFCESEGIELHEDSMGLQILSS